MDRWLQESPSQAYWSPENQNTSSQATDKRGSSQKLKELDRKMARDLKQLEASERRKSKK